MILNHGPPDERRGFTREVRDDFCGEGFVIVVAVLLPEVLELGVMVEDVQLKLVKGVEVMGVSKCDRI